MRAADCTIACRASTPGTDCRCDRHARAPGTTDASARFPLRLVDCSAPVSNAIVALCLQAQATPAESHLPLL